ncbi:MAG: hypothetical protein JNG90_15525 [Planctomycetaceae bacterium]|nr:hypothetical protein [Planctomycetaceae bacterium]
MGNAHDNPYQANGSDNLRRHGANEPAPAQRSWRKAALLLLLTAVVAWLIVPWLAVRLGELFGP